MAESSGYKKGKEKTHKSEMRGKPSKSILAQCLCKWINTTAQSGRSFINNSQPVFQLAVKYSVPQSMIMINIQNLCQQVIIVQSISLLDSTTNESITLFYGDLRMVPNYKFIFKKERMQIIDDRSYNILILSQSLDTDGRLLESHTIKLLPSKRRLSLKPMKLSTFPVPQEIKELYSNGFLHKPHYSVCASQWLDRLQLYSKQGLNPSNYVNYLNMLNQIDDYDDYKSFQQYTIDKAIFVEKDSNHLLLSHDQFKVSPRLLKNGSVVVAYTNMNNRVVKFRGLIVESRLKSFLIRLPPTLQWTSPKLVFPQNRTQFQREYEALDRISCHSLKDVLFPSHGEKVDKPDSVSKGQSFSSFEWFHPQISKNKQQQLAIKNIVNRTAYPAPYILFGPPGTGKTFTIVEAVLQIWKLRANSRILVTSMSNFACNDLTLRLLKYMEASEIFRYFSCTAARSINEIDPKVLQVSNMNRRVYETPTMEDFTKTRILVCTVMNSGRLMQLNIGTTMYDYIFIDECGSSKEISALVPIGSVGFREHDTKLHASIVLAGDPKQLGPVTRFEYLKQTPHNTSLLERLMELPFYRKDHNNNGYNTQVIMKLLDNYRSHASLIEFSNREFYESELRAKGPPTETAWAVNWQQLPNPKFPMFFVSVFGQMNRNPVSLSYCNRDEAKVVFRYVQLLVKGRINNRIIRPEDIGIVTPYSSQVEYIRNGLSKLGFDAVEIGSAEQYQGREKPVIIISTVRSNTNSVGFLADHRRLNVVLTRAQALCIIIGNPNTLMLDKTWYSFLSFIKDNKSIRGKDFELIRFPSPSLESIDLIEKVFGQLNVD